METPIGFEPIFRAETSTLRENEFGVLRLGDNLKLSRTALLAPLRAFRSFAPLLGRCGLASTISPRSQNEVLPPVASGGFEPPRSLVFWFQIEAELEFVSITQIV